MPDDAVEIIEILGFRAEIYDAGSCIFPVHYFSPEGEWLGVDQHQANQWQAFREEVETNLRQFNHLRCYTGPIKIGDRFTSTLPSALVVEVIEIVELNTFTGGANGGIVVRDGVGLEERFFPVEKFRRHFIQT